MLRLFAVILLFLFLVTSGRNQVNTIMENLNKGKFTISRFKENKNFQNLSTTNSLQLTAFLNKK